MSRLRWTGIELRQKAAEALDLYGKEGTFAAIARHFSIGRQAARRLVEKGQEYQQQAEEYQRRKK